MRLNRKSLRTGILAGLVATSLVLAGCADSDRDDDGDGGGGGETASGGTFVFAGSAEPTALDPFLVSDGESFRVARQIFEGLVGTVPGTADPAPLLAKSWKSPLTGCPTPSTSRPA